MTTTRITAHQIAPTGMARLAFTHNGRTGHAIGCHNQATHVSIDYDDGARDWAEAPDGLTVGWLTDHLG